jgi:hypothetical protein
LIKCQSTVAPDSGTITATFPATGSELPSFTVGGTAQNLNIFGAGAGTEVTALTEEEGFNITYGSSGYGGAYAYFEVDFGSGKTLADYPKLTFKWKGIAGDIANKELSVWVSEAAFSGSVTQTNRAGYQNFSGNNDSERDDGEIYLYAPAVTSQKAYIALNIWAAATGGTPAVATNYEVYDIAFEGYTPEAVTLLAIPGVAAPIAGATPVTTVSNNAQYVGTISWKDADDVELDEDFDVSTVYTATITLTAKPPYTFTGVLANSFTVATIPATNAADSGIVTVTFPETAGAALTSIPITIQGATGATTEITLTDVTKVNADVSLIPDGYLFAQNGNQYDWSWAKFTINLGDKTLADFKAVTLTFSYVSGDAGNKRIFLLAATTTDTTFSGGGTAVGWDNGTSSSTRSVTKNGGADQYSNMSPANADVSPKNMTLEIDTTTTAYTTLSDESELQIAIYGHMNSGSSYEITNITFVAND